MANKILKVLLTGPPRSGKTTIIKKTVFRLRNKGLELNGFYTEEIIDSGKRIGFKLVGLDGKEKIFSHISFKTSFRVSKYKVDINVLDDFLNRISLSSEKIIVIDEIGKMECFSEKFKSFVLNLLNSSLLFLGTIAIKGDPFIERIKAMPHIKLIYVTKQNRDSLPSYLADMFYDATKTLE